MRKVFILVCMLSLTGCVISKTVNLVPEQLSPLTIQQEVREIIITSPKVGEEILVFGDYISGGNIINGVTVLFDNYKRADFKYNLTNDVKPRLEQLFKSAYKIQENSTRIVTVDVNFKYYIPSTGAFSNVIGIAMKVHLKELEGNVITFEKLYEINKTEKYSTFPVTYPREESFRSLYTKALNSFVSQLDNRTSYNKILNPTPGSVAALRGYSRGGAG